LRLEVLTEVALGMDPEPEPEPAKGQAVTALFSNAVAQVQPSSKQSRCLIRLFENERRIKPLPTHLCKFLP
jgi:hypothetical protein